MHSILDQGKQKSVCNGRKFEVSESEMLEVNDGINCQLTADPREMGLSLK